MVYLLILMLNMLSFRSDCPRPPACVQNLLQSAISETPQPGKMDLDILELNHLRRSLLIGSHVWDHRLYSLDSLIKRSSTSKVKH